MNRRLFLVLPFVSWFASRFEEKGIAGTIMTVPHGMKYVVGKAGMVVSVDRGDRGLVYDANGREIGEILEANLTTGRCVVIKTTRDGEPVLNNRGDAIEKLVIYHPAPMHFSRKILPTP